MHLPGIRYRRYAYTLSPPTTILLLVACQREKIPWWIAETQNELSRRRTLIALRAHNHDVDPGTSPPSRGARLTKRWSDNEISPQLAGDMPPSRRGKVSRGARRRVPRCVSPPDPANPHQITGSKRLRVRSPRGPPRQTQILNDNNNNNFFSNIQARAAHVHAPSAQRLPRREALILRVVSAFALALHKLSS